jgi:hypothetical protein
VKDVELVVQLAVILVDGFAGGVVTCGMLSVTLGSGHCPSSSEWGAKSFVGLQEGFLEVFAPWLPGVGAWLWLLGPLLCGFWMGLLRKVGSVAFKGKDMVAWVGVSTVGDIGCMCNLETQAKPCNVQAQRQEFRNNKLSQHHGQRSRGRFGCLIGLKFDGPMMFLSWLKNNNGHE